MNTQELSNYPRSSVIGTLALLLAFVLPGPSALAEDEEERHEYVGAGKCKTCHEKENIGNQYGKWLSIGHSKAYETLKTEQSKKWAAEAGVDDPLTDEKCAKCHITAFGVDEEWLGTKYNPEEGVSCESCHGAGRDYRKKAVMIDREKSKEKGLHIPTVDTCLPCHNDESPAWDPARYTLANGSKTGFDYEQAVKLIAHPVPEDFDPLADGEAD